MIDLTKIHALADGELSGEEKAAVEAMIAQDDSCRREFAAILEVKQCVNQKCPECTCDMTWKKSVERLNELDQANRVNGFVGRYAWALCAVFLLCIVAGGLRSRATGGSLRPSEAYEATLFPMSKDPGQMKRAVSEYIGAPSVGDRVEITSVATGHVNEQQVMKVGLRDDQGDMSLVIVWGKVSMQEGVEPILNTRYYRSQIDQLNCLAWTQGEAVMMLLGDRSPEALCDIADAVPPLK